MKRIGKLAIISMLSMSILSGCSEGSTEGSSGEGETVNIGITQLMQHPALDKNREGFIKALEDNGYVDGENIVIDYQNAQGDMPTSQTIANQFKSDDKDLIFAVSTGSAQAAYNATKDIPILISSVTDPIEAGLAKSLEDTQNNIGGTTDYIPIDKVMESTEVLDIEVKDIGVIYNTSEANSKVQVDKLKAYAKENNYNVHEVGVTSTNEINQAITSIAKDIDVLYVPTDNLVVSAMPIVSEKSLEYNIPVIASEEGSVENGALVANGIDYYKLGYKTGEMAVEILNGADISEVGIKNLDEVNLIINENTLNTLKINKPSDDNITYIK